MPEYEAGVTSPYGLDEEYALLDLSMPSDKLLVQLDTSLRKSRDHWNNYPWSLEDTDKRADRFLYPNLGSETEVLGMRVNQDEKYDDDVLFESMRAILSYATGQLGVPDITPSETTAEAKRIARNMGLGVYQHSLDENVDQKVRAMAQAQISRKRSYLKLRLDPLTGDVVTDVVPPEDVTLDEFATYMGNPLRVHQRLHCTVDELCQKYPKLKQQIMQAFSIVQGRYTQMSRMVYYYETWFTYLDAQGKSREAVATWLHEPTPLLLDKSPNPNWIYTGNDDKDTEQNLTKLPPKPFISINYLNSGKSAIDETCLFDQAIGTQVTLNARSAQWHKNIDYVNGRWIYNLDKMSEDEATRLVNKGAKSLLGVKSGDGPVANSLANIASQALPPEVYESIADLRQRIKDKMGTPNQFSGQEGGKQNTLGRDIMLKQQAGALQDDFVRAIQTMYGTYYEVKLQIMRVNSNKDQKLLVKGANGEHQEVILGPDTLDANVKIGVKADSTLPLDKAAIRQMSIQLAGAPGRIALGDLYQDLGYPDPEYRTERALRSGLDPLGYLSSITMGIEQSDARDDIDAVIAGRDPRERDEYDQNYLESYNQFITTNEFAMLSPQIKQALVAHLSIVQHIASQQVTLQETMLDEAGITTGPITPPAPKSTIQYRVASTGPAPGAQPTQPPAFPGQPGVPPTAAPPGVNPLK